MFSMFGLNRIDTIRLETLEYPVIRAQGRRGLAI